MAKFNYDKINSMIHEDVLKEFILIGRDESVKYGKYILEHIDSGILFSAYLNSIKTGSLPNIISCKDKTSYYKYLLNNVNPSITLISDYVNEYTDIIIENEDGLLFKTRPSSLLKGSNPTYATCIDGGTKLFIKNAKEIHGEKYIYDNVKYIKQSEFIDIKCPIHGLFTQVAQSHLNGNGCPVCAKEINASGFTKTDWINKAKSSNNFNSFIVYVIECWNNEERFIKIGRTYTKIYLRFKNGLNSSLPYYYKVIDTISGEGDYVYNLENHLHSKLYNYKYNPKIIFNGSTECFNVDALEIYKKYI